MVRCAVSLLLVVALVGCTRQPPAIVPAEGVVLLEGRPLPGAEVQFVPLIQGFGGEYIATAVTDAQGRFVLRVLGRDGACACENQITVAEGPLPDDARGQSAAAQVRASQFLASLPNRPIPPRYANLAQSPLKLIVTADKREYQLELTR